MWHWAPRMLQDLAWLQDQVFEHSRVRQLVVESSPGRLPSGIPVFRGLKEVHDAVTSMSARRILRSVHCGGAELTASVPKCGVALK